MTLEEFIAHAKEHENAKSLKSGWPWPDPPPIWESDYGTKVNLMDDSSIRKSIGFSFIFFGKWTYTRVWINSNGNLTFNGSNSDDYTIPVPNRSFLAPLAGDFNPDYRDGWYGKVYCKRPRNKRF